MRNKAILLISLLITSGLVLAGSIIENVGEQVLKDKVTSAVPKEAVTAVGTASQKVDEAKKLKDKVPTSTGEAAHAIKNKAKEEAAKKAIDLLK